MARILKHTFAQVGVSELEVGDLFIQGDYAYELVEVIGTEPKDGDGDTTYKLDVYETSSQNFTVITVLDRETLTVIYDTED